MHHLDHALGQIERFGEVDRGTAKNFEVGILTDIGCSMSMAFGECSTATT
jgi:hypothetical protein